MKFILKVEHIFDPDLDTPILLMLKFKAKSKDLHDGGTEYEIVNPVKQKIAEQFIPLAIAKGVDIQGYPMFLKVNKSATDNKVPSDWPDAMMVDPKDETKQITKRFDQYTVIKNGITESLMKICHWSLACETPNNFSSLASPTTPEELNRFIDYLAGGDVTKVLFGSSLKEWLSDNVD